VEKYTSATRVGGFRFLLERRRYAKAGRYICEA